MPTIYRKTSKGQTEIETRALKLAPRFRNLLILVDGRRSDADLMQLLPQVGLEAVEALAQGGFIEAIGVTAEPAAASRKPPAAAPTVPPASAPGFEQRRRDAVRMLIDQVGPVGETLALRIERARNEQDLTPLIDTAVQLINNTRGRTTALAYAQRFGSPGTKSG